MEADVLVFFDFCSLAQMPRTDDEDAEFRLALQNMGTMYYIFPVLIISYIPEDVQLKGRYISYTEKGWCFTEANIAAIGNQLDSLSSKEFDILKHSGALVSSEHAADAL